MTNQIPKEQPGSFNLSKALFILPNAFTAASVCCGMYAILHAVSENGPEAFYQSSIAVFFAGFFDLFDGRVARMTRTQSDFGVQFDSLADVINFGVAPAVIVYKWALWPMGGVGMLAAFIFAACGAIRLARHNVLTMRKPNSQNYFVGLPIPFGAALLVAIVIAHFKLFDGLPVQRHNLVFVTVISIALLMVSTVPYWTFKNFRFQTKSALLALLLILIAIGISTIYQPSVTLVVFVATYVAAGLVHSIYVRLNLKSAGGK